MSKKDRPVNFLVSDEEHELLKRLSKSHDLSMGAFLRKMLRTFRDHEVNGIPHCANGNRCLFPHLLPQSQNVHNQDTPPSHGSGPYSPIPNNSQEQ